MPEPSGSGTSIRPQRRRKAPLALGDRARPGKRPTRCGRAMLLGGGASAAEDCARRGRDVQGGPEKRRAGGWIEWIKTKVGQRGGQGTSEAVRGTAVVPSTAQAARFLRAHGLARSRSTTAWLGATYVMPFCGSPLLIPSGSGRTAFASPQSPAHSIDPCSRRSLRSKTAPSSRRRLPSARGPRRSGGGMQSRRAQSNLGRGPSPFRSPKR